MPPFVPGIVPGTNRVCPRDKSGEIGLPLCRIRRKPGFVPGTNPVKSLDKPGVVPRPTGQTKIMFMCFFLAWTWLFAIFTQKRSFAPFGALLHFFCGLAFALICVYSANDCIRELPEQQNCLYFRGPGQGNRLRNLARLLRFFGSGPPNRRLEFSGEFGERLRGNTVRDNRTESLWEGSRPLRGSLRGRVFRGRFHSQRLSVLLPLIALPLNLSPKNFGACFIRNFVTQKLGGPIAYTHFRSSPSFKEENPVYIYI